MRPLLTIALFATILLLAPHAEAWTRSGGTTGQNGYSVTSSGNGSCSGGTCSSSGTATGPRGYSASRQGSTSCSGGTCTSSGTATGPHGNSLSRNGSVSR